MTKLGDVDREALKRCIKMARTYPGRSEQINWKLGEGGCSWEDTAKFCAYLCQSRNLRLEIQEFPPCWLLDVDDVEGPIFKRKVEGARLLRRLLAAGLSQYEPDPIAALAAAKKLQAAE
jgi:hypothetical protein